MGPQITGRQSPAPMLLAVAGTSDIPCGGPPCYPTQNVCKRPKNAGCRIPDI